MTIICDSNEVSGTEALFSYICKDFKWFAAFRRMNAPTLPPDRVRPYIWIKEPGLGGSCWNGIGNQTPDKGCSHQKSGKWTDPRKGQNRNREILQGGSSRFPHFKGANAIAYNDEIPVKFYLSFKI